MLDIIFVLSILAFLGFLSVLIIVFTCNRFLIGVKMSVNYEQHCMIGVSFDFDELKRVTSKAEYKLEDRYDIRTGKVTHQEKILVKEEKVRYELCGRIFDYIEDIQIDGLFVEYDDDYLYIGLPVTEPVDLGRVTLLEDSFDLLNLEKIQDRVKNILPQYANRIGIHLFYTIR